MFSWFEEIQDIDPMFTYSVAISRFQTPNLWKKYFFLIEANKPNELLDWLRSCIPDQYEFDIQGAVLFINFKTSDSAALFKLAWDDQR